MDYGCTVLNDSQILSNIRNSFPDKFYRASLHYVNDVFIFLPDRLIDPSTLLLFEAIFMTDFDDGCYIPKINACEITRLIKTTSLAKAKMVAEAMLGEEIYSGENLARVKSICLLDRPSKPICRRPARHLTPSHRRQPRL